MKTRFRSLQAQLVLRLAAGFIVATLLAVSAIVYEGTQAAQSLGDDELERRAVQIAHFVERGPDGELHLTLPARLDQLYQSPARTRLANVGAHKRGFANLAGVQDTGKTRVMAGKHQSQRHGPSNRYIR